MTEDTEPTYVDVSNLPELKDTCDAAIERILSRLPAASATTSNPQADNTDTANVSLTPASDPKPDDSEDGDEDGASTSSQLQAPWTASHLLGDIKLLLGYLSAFLLVGVSAWSYKSTLPMDQKRYPNLVAVGLYILSAILQQLLTWYQRDALFVGRRRASQHGIILTERLTVRSVPLPAPKLLPPEQEKAKPRCVPPEYLLRMQYVRSSNKGKTLLKSADQPLTLGHLGEWFASDGEFLQDVFEQRLRAALAKIVD